MPPAFLPIPLRIPLLLALLPMAWGMGEPPLEQLRLWDKNPDACNRTALLQYLRHQDIKVRSAALDLLESVTGTDFGLDPWLAPQETPAPVQRALEEWVHAGDSLGSAGQAPTPGQLREAVALLRTADPDTQRRICLRFSRFRSVFTAALQQELEGMANRADPSAEKERDRLRCAQFRAQLQGGGTPDAGLAATKLTSHARADMLEGLEELRKAGKEALPVLMQFVSSPHDALVREVAVDVLMERGGLQAFHAIQPMLMAEDDRNILQIAARRAADCQADAALVAFLGKCALSPDEDIALAGLEALGSISADRDEEADDGDGSSAPASAPIPCALEPGQCIALLQSPHWRVRAAALSALRSTAPFLPSLYDAGIQDALLACLQDEDETVRQTAMEVIYKRKLTRLRSSDLEAFALRTPSHAAFVLYQFCESGIPLTPALLELPSRFDARQVEQLEACDDEGRSVFAANSPSPDALAVLGKLMQNPDARVRRRLMKWCGPYLYSFREEWAEAYKEWLMDANVPEPDKGEALSDLLHHFRYNGRKSVGRARDDAALNAWLQQEMERTPGMGSSRAAYALLLFLHPREFSSIAAGMLPLLDSETLESLAESRPEAFLQLDAPALSRLINEHRDLADELLGKLGKYARGKELLSRLELHDAAWSAIFSGSSSLLHREEGKAPDWMFPLLFRTMESAPSPRRRQEAAYLYLACRHSMANAYRASGEEVPPEPAALHGIIRSAPPAQAEALECMLRAPFLAEEIEPWARQFASGKNAHVRCAVASCLLPLDGWVFCLPPAEQQDTAFYAPPPMKGRGELRRSSCPASLLALVRGMQQDADPAVALIACASVLYRTGSCDQARMADLLSRFKQQMDEAQEGDGDEASLLPQLKAPYHALGQVWRRWFQYRGSTHEPFKLKGNPRKIKPGVIPLLRQLKAINDETWGVDGALSQQLGNRQADGSALAGQLLPHEFRFSLPQENDTSPTPGDAAPPHQALQPPAAGEDPACGDEEDAPEPQPLDTTAPVRLEFFHQKGCDTCSRVRKRLADMQQAYPGLHVADYDIASPEGFERNDVLCQRFGIPHRDRHKAPALFAEGGYLLGEDAAGDALQHLLENSLARGQEGKRLAASARPPEPQLPTPESTPPSPAPSEGMLAAASADEKQQARTAQTGKTLRSYGLLALGAAAVLFSLALLLFSRRHKGETPKDGMP